VHGSGVLEIRVDGVHEFTGLAGGGAGGDVDVGVYGGGLTGYSGFCLGVSDVGTVGNDFVCFGHGLYEGFDLCSVNFVDLVSVGEVDELPCQ